MGSIHTGAATAWTAGTNSLTGPFAKGPTLLDLLKKVDSLLQTNEAEKALKLLASAKLNSPWSANAIGVCQLRLHNAQVAMNCFRSLAIGTGGITLRTDIPAVFKTNFAVALLEFGNISGCQSTLAEMNEQDHPAVGRLRSDIRKWTKNLSLWEKITWYLGGTPARPVQLSSPAGDLE